jgi:hypothetical protein
LGLLPARPDEAERRAHVASLDLAGLEALGATLKQTLRWPG